MNVVFVCGCEEIQRNRRWAENPRSTFQVLEFWQKWSLSSLDKWKQVLEIAIHSPLTHNFFHLSPYKLILLILLLTLLLLLLFL